MPTDAILAERVVWKRGLWAQTQGLMGRKQVSSDCAVVFPQPRAFRVPIWMLGVRTPLCVVWCVGGVVEQVARLPAWTGVGVARADMVVELHASHADRIRAGDELAVADGALHHR